MSIDLVTRLGTQPQDLNPPITLYTPHAASSLSLLGIQRLRHVGRHLGAARRDAADGARTAGEGLLGHDEER